MKYTSKLADQQLDYIEDLMIQGQQNVVISEKQFSDLVKMTDDILKQKVSQHIICTCVLVIYIYILSVTVHASLVAILDHHIGGKFQWAKDSWPLLHCKILQKMDMLLLYYVQYNV